MNVTQTNKNQSQLKKEFPGTCIEFRVFDPISNVNVEREVCSHHII